MKENKIQLINEIITSKDFFGNKGIILEILVSSETRNYFIQKFPNQFKKIDSVDFVLKNLLKDQQGFSKTIEILQNSLSKENNKFIIEFLGKYKKVFEEKAQFSTWRDDLEILKKIAGSDQREEIMRLLLDYSKKHLESNKDKFKSRERISRDIEEKRRVADILNSVFDFYTSNKKKERVQEIINLVKDIFVLNDDNSGFEFRTPKNVFGLIEKYITSNQDLNEFQKRIEEIKKAIVKQENQKLKKRDYKGWDLWGSGISQSGSEFHINDKAMVDLVFAPAILKQYQKSKQKTWDFVEKEILEKKTSRSNPDFLKRSCIDLLIERMKTKSHRKESLNYLEKFIQETRGVPKKSELIFYKLENSKVELSLREKWSLVEADLSKHSIPSNVFVEKRLGELASKGNSQALEEIKKLFKNKEFFKNLQIKDYGLNFMLSPIVEKYPEEGAKIVENFFSSDFINQVDRFDVFNISKLAVEVIEKNMDKGLGILESVYESGEKLSENKQILITNVLDKLEGKNKKYLKRGYEFIYPKISSEYHKFTFPGSRELISRFSDLLAKAKLFQEALDLINISIEDQESPTLGDEMQKKLENGEDEVSISTAKGWACWALASFVVTDGRPFISQVINLVKKLSQDPHPYVRQMACFPLGNLSKFRYSKTPEGEWFAGEDQNEMRQNAKKIEKIVFGMLDDERNWKIKTIMNNLVFVLGNCRSLTQEEAWKVISVYYEKVDKDIREEVFQEFVPLVFFYAEFRKEAFKNWKHKNLGSYDEKIFQKKAKEIIKNSSEEVKGKFAFQVLNILEEGRKDGKDFLARFEKYFDILLSGYNRMVLTHFYHLIEGGMKDDKDNFEEYYNLWRKCLKAEKKYLESMTPEEVGGWSIHRNHGSILLKIKENLGEKEFIDSLEFLSNYPKEASIGSDIYVAVEEVAKMKSKKAQKVFDKLVEKNPLYEKFRI